MKKILFVSSSSAGGAERMTVLYSKILKKSGFDCRFLISSFPSSQILITEFIPQNIKYEFIRLHYKLLISLQFLFRILNYRPDIIFCSQPGNSVSILKLKRLRLLKSKFVYREFLMPSDNMNGIDKRARFLKYADLLIAQTTEMKEEMVKYYHIDPSKVKVINNPIDTDLIREKIEETYPFDHSYTNYIAMNRVSPQKDMLTMLKAFEIVKLTEPNSRLYVCGSTSDKVYYGELMEFVTKHYLTDSVFFEGPQSNPFKYLNSADVFCLSSIYEGLPNSMLEAMYLGVPVAVTSSIPFIEQIVEVGKQGFLATPKDYVGFADAMLKAAKLPRQNKYVEPIASSEEIVTTFNKL